LNQIAKNQGLDYCTSRPWSDVEDHPSSFDATVTFVMISQCLQHHFPINWEAFYNWRSHTREITSI